MQVPGAPAGIPFNINGVLALLNTIDRDVILARSDVSARPVDFKKFCPDRISLDGCNYQAVITTQIPSPIPNDPPEGLAIERGFVVADARVNGKAYALPRHILN